MSNNSVLDSESLLLKINPNRYLLSKFNSDAGILDRRELTGKFRKALAESSSFASEIHSATRNTLLGSESTIPGNVAGYETCSLNPGETFLPLITADARVSQDFTPLIQVYQAPIPETFSPGLKHSLTAARRAVTELLKRKYPGMIAVEDDEGLELCFRIVNRKREEISIEFTGRSFELPLALAMFSYLVKKPLIESIAATGKILIDNSIDTVDGIDRKMNATFEEYPEVTHFIVPENGINTIPDEKKNKVYGVNNIEAALERLIPSFFNNFPHPDILEVPGVHYLKYSTIQFGDEVGQMITVVMSGNMSPSCIVQFSEILPNGNCGIVVLNGRMPIWLAQYFSVKLFNKVKILAMNDPKLNDPQTRKNGAVVISSTTGIKSGTVILYS